MKKKKMKKVLSASLTASLVASSLPLPHTALAEEATNDSSNATANEATGTTPTATPSGEATSTLTAPTGGTATENTGITDAGSTTTPAATTPTTETPANNDSTANTGEAAKPADTTPAAPAPEAEKFGGEVSFEIKKDQSLVDKNDIVFKNAKDETITINTIENERNKFDFSKTKKDEEIKFEVTVSGYKKFRGSFTVKEGNQKEVLDLTELDQVTIPSDGIQKIYGDSDFTITPLLKLPSDYNGEIHYTLQSGEEIATVSDSGSVTVKNPGDAVVHITAKRTDNYAAIDATILLKVAKKNLGQINNSMIEWGPLTKVYDGSTTYAAEGKLKASAGLVGQDEVKVKAEFELNSANVGTQRTTVSQISYVGIADKYQYTSELNEGPTIEVTPKEIHVTTKDVSTSYASDDWKVYRSGQVPAAVTLKDVLSFVDVSETDKAAIDALNLNDAFVLSGSNGDYTVGKAADKLSVTLKNPLLGNYKFVLDKDKSSVDVTKDTRNTDTLWANVLLDEATSKNAFVSGNNVFVKPGGILNFKLGDTSVYDQLNIKSTNLDNPAFGQSLAIPESSISKDIEGVFYLSNSKSADTRTDETVIPNNYKVDADVPVVEFVDGSKIFASIFNAGTTAFSDSKEAIEFAKSNSKTGYVLRLNSSDSGSGLKSVQYSLLKVTSDADAKAKIREAVIGDSLTWKDVENNALQVDPTEEGYYIVVVKAKDNVGNEALYASNGFALDLTNPNVSVTGLPDLTKVHSSAVPYTVTVVDPVTNGVATGIARVDVVVKNNGVEIPNQDGRVNSYSVLSKDLYGQDDLSTFSDFDMAKVEKQFTGSIDADGNNLSLEITAYDKAGNKVTTKEISGIKIDKSGAKVTGTYDNTPLSNGKYLTASRRLTATFTDRNFVEENAKVSFTVDGTTTDYTIEQIRSGAVKGLRLVSDKVDSEAGRADTAFTNDRTNTYVFEIYNQSNEEHTYSVGLGYSKNGTDYAGEISGEAKDGFVIDNVAPELALQFVNGNKEAVEISKDSANPTYEHVSIAPTLVIKEKNFNPKDVKVTITSKDSKGNAGPAYTYTADALTNPDSWTKDGDTHTFALSAFTEDANYSIAFEYTDLAGNKVTTDTYYFTVDKTKPTGSLTVVDNGTQVEYNELSDKSTFEHVSSGQLSVKSQSFDETSGIKSVKYYAYKPAADANGEFSLPTGSELEQFEWVDTTSDLTFNEDGQFVIYQRMEDKAGNVSYVNTKGALLIDKTDPEKPEITLVTETSKKDVYNKDVTASIHAEDKEANGTYSGLQTVKVEVLNQGKVTQSKVYNVASKQARQKAFDGQVTVDAALNNSNDVVIRVTSTDWAGNVSTNEHKFIIDTVAPRIEVAFDKNDGKENRYYNQTRTATVKVYERNFDPEKVGITVNGGKAIISDWKVGTDVSDENVSTATITFSQDGDYTFDVKATDLAENSFEYKHADVFTIDTVAPELSIDFLNADNKGIAMSKEATSPSYQNFVKPVLKVKEKNFNPKDVVLHVTSKNSKGQDGVAYEYSTALLTNQGSWIEKDGIHEYQLNEFNTDSNYSFAFEYTDLAGNRVMTDTYYFTVDKTKPTGSLTVVDNGTQVEYNELSDKSMFEHVSSGQLSVKSQSFDETSGIKSVKYYAYKPAVDANGEFSLPTGSELEKFDWVDTTSDLTFNENGQVVIYQRMEDKAGNVSYVNTKGALLIDKTAPEKPEITLVTKTAKKDVYNTNVTASIHTEDKEVNGTYSGLQTVKVEVLNQGKVTQSKVYNVASKQARQKAFDGEITVDASLNNSNDVVIRVTSTDWAGNVSTNEHKFIIDTVAPRIEIIWDNSEAKNGRYYNHARTATVKVYERNFVADDAKITVNGGEASVSNWAVGGEVSDENVSTATITFAKDGEYTFDVAVTDLAGNSSTKSHKDSFVIDTVAPEANISFHGGTSGAVTGSLEQTKPTYDRSSMTATLNIKEKNFDPKDVVLHVQATDGKGNQIAAYSTSNTTVAGMGAWSNEGDNHSYSLAAFTEDANYSISMEYTDLAGNHVVTPTYYFTVDKTAPVGSLNVSSSDGAMQYKEAKDSASFEHVTSGSVQVGSEADDITSGLASVQYYLYHPDVEARGTFALPSNQALEQFTWSPWTSNLNLDTDQQVVVYQRMEDKAGNVSYVNTSGAIIIDKTVPAKPSIELVTPPSGNGRYNGDVTGKIHVEDQVAGGTYSGLKTVTVEVLNGDHVTQTQTYEVGSKQDRTKAFDTSVVVDSKLNNSNFVKIRVTTTDWAGNVSTGEQELSIDTVAPRIEVSFDTNDGKNGRYYNQARTATVRIYERNFDPNGVNIAIHGGNASISGWSVGSDAGVSDENVNIATITFSEDGDYTFDIQATDQASNSSDYKHTDLFTIDVTKPTLSVSWDKELVNGKYVASARTATITVQEHNFDPAGLTAAIKASLESQGISAPSVGGWSSNGDTHTASLTFADDGDYSFTLDFEDMAGNKSETLTENEFTVDSTVPEITFEGVQDHASYKDEVKPVVRFTDRNFDPSQISLKLKGYRHQEVDLTGSLSEITNGGVVSVADFVHDADVDDVYTLTAEITDKAGNKTSKSITFSVNRFGSNYFFSNQTEQYLEKFYHNKEEDIVIHEVNTDSLVRNDLVVTKDGSSIKVSKNDYTVEDISSNGWKEYVYTVKASVFEKEGRYEVTIDSEDAAGNQQSNQIKEKPATFVIDKTDPSAVITGVANGEIYNALERDIEIVPTDNILVGKIELLLDGKVVKEFDLTENDGLNNKFEYKLLESNKWQEVQVKVTDAAGNVATSSKLKVLITPDSMVRFLNSLWFKVIVGTGSTGLLAAILWLILGKKKKDEEKG